jgi:hypothetical protein
MQRNPEGSSPILRKAIQQLRKLVFHYNGLRRQRDETRDLSR